MFKGIFIQNLFPVIVIVGSCNLKAKNNCQIFRTGKFSQRSELVKGENIIVRTGDIQTEIRGSDTVKSKVKWTDDCSYELTYLPSRSVESQLIGKTIKVKITKTTADYYLYEAELVGTTLTSKDTIVKVSD